MNDLLQYAIWGIFGFIFHLPTHSQTYIPFKGAPIYLNGINIPWNHFGWDIGRHPQKGIGYDSLWFEEAFSTLASEGVNSARFWIHTDGRASPEFLQNGFVTGLDGIFFEHLDDLVQRAEAHNIYLIFCLWTFELVQDKRSCCGQFAGNHSDLIREPAKTQSYIDQVLIPMVKRYAQSCAVFAWEIINEPEWAIENIGTEKGVVPKVDMQRFVAMQAEAIHAHSDQLVTVGSASLKWNSSYTPPTKGNFWSDEALQQAWPSAGSYLDFYQIHFYDWMKEGRANFDPYSRPADFWNLEKPTIIGEASPYSSYYNPNQMLQNAFHNAFAGHFFWSYAANGNTAGWNASRNAINDFSQQQAELIGYRCKGETPEQSYILFSPNPALAGQPFIIEIATETLTGLHLQIFDAMGRKVRESSYSLQAAQHTIKIVNRLRAAGIYFISINGGPFKKLLIL